MRNKILAIVLLATVLAGIFIKQQFAYPKAWDEVHLGMAQQDVYELLGKPDQYWSEKGAFWGQSNLTQFQELQIYFDNNKVVLVKIHRCIGTRQTFMVQNIRFESAIH